jgi:tetratricopeptide (TPR) repeat protein
MKPPHLNTLLAEYNQIHTFDEKLIFLQNHIRKYVYFNSPYVDFIVELYLILANLLLQRGWYEECIEACSRALDFDKDNPESMEIIQHCKNIEVYYHQAQKYHQMHFYRKEIECYEQILKISPEDSNAWFNSGNCYLLEYQYGKAIECYENAIQIDPLDEQAWFNLAYSYEKYNLPEQAIDAYSRLLSINPQHERAWLNRGHIYFMTGNLPQAQNDYLNAYRLGEEEALYLLSEIQKKIKY